MPKYQTQTTGVLAGLNEDENPHSLKDNELTKGQNLARFGREMGTRPGLVRPGSAEDYENALADAGPVQGLFEYRQNFDAGRRLLAVSESSGGNASAQGAGVFYEDAAELDLNTNSVRVTNGQDHLWSFAENQNNLFAAGGEFTSAASADDIWYWDGTVGNAVNVLALTDSSGNRIRPKFIINFGGYMVINGMRGGTISDNNPAVTRYATFGAAPTSTNSWPNGNTIGFNAAALAGVTDFGKLYTTGLARYEDNSGKFLMVLGNSAIASAKLNVNNDFEVTDGIPNGCVHHRAFVSLGLDAGDAVYMSDRGVHSLRQSQTHGVKEDTFISWKIRKTFSALNQSRLQFSVGAYDFLRGRVVFAVSSGSDTKHDTLLCLDVKDQNTLTASDAVWTIWKITGTPSGFSEKLTINDLLFARDASGDHHLYAGTNTGDVIRFSEETFSDLDTAYPVELQTKHRDYGSSGTDKKVGDWYVTLSPPGNYTVTGRVVFDFGRASGSGRAIDMNVSTGASWGSAVWGQDVWPSGSETFLKKVYGAGAGATVAFNLSNSGKNEPFRVSKIDHDIAVVGEEVGRAAA